MYSSPTSRGAPEGFPPAYHAHHGQVAAPQERAVQSPLKPRVTHNLCQTFMATGSCPAGDSCPYSHGRGVGEREGSAFEGRHSSPPPFATHQDRPRGAYHQAPAHHSHPPPPPYGAAPPPPYEGMHSSPVSLPPPPSYHEHMHAMGSRHATPITGNGRDASPSRREPGTPTAEGVRFRHDPYSPGGSRVVSPNRRDMA